MSQTLSLISSAIESNDSDYLSKLFDIKFINASSDSFRQIAQSPSMISKVIDTKYWVEIIKNITSMSLCNDEASPELNMHKAFQYYFIASTIFNQNQQDINVSCAIFKSICRTCLYFSHNNLCYNDCHTLLTKYIYPSALNPRTRAQIRSNDPVLLVANSIVQILLMRNNYNVAEKSFISLNRKNIFDTNSFTVSELASYYFLKGKIDMVYGNRNLAYMEFSKSLQYLPLNYKKDRRLVLTHLIPVKLSFGMVPTDELLNTYDLSDLYSDLATAVSTGNLELFNQALNTHQTFFIRIGVWEMVIYSKKMVLRRILEMVKEQISFPIINIEAFRMAICLFDEEFSFEDAVLEVSNLIYDKLVMANIAYQQKMIVFKRSDEFKLPNPEEIEETDK